MALSWFWSEWFWLPANTTWDDYSNGPGKVVHAEAKDYWVQITLVTFGLTLRFLSDRYIFAPLGRHLKISDYTKKAPPNAKLEAAYLRSSTCKDASSLAKQLDITERQVERWWRLRRAQDKPTKLVKFCEDVWKGINYSINVFFGLYVVWGQEWVTDVDLCFDGHPHQGVTPEMWWLYMISSSYYISLVITQFHDVRRKDFWQMFVHHIATIILLYTSWVAQCFRIGSLVLILHDMGDIFLELGKAAKYAGYRKMVDWVFVGFVIVWVVTRLVLIPCYVLPKAYVKLTLTPSPVIFLMDVLLALLFVLSVMWSWLIFNAVKKTVLTGQYLNDDRSSNSEDSDANEMLQNDQNGEK